jgi:ribosomal protein L33
VLSGVKIEVLCPECFNNGRRTSAGKHPRLEKGKYCRVCGFKLIIEKKDRSNASKRAWVERRRRYGDSGMGQAKEMGDLFP